ncbi:unnamed protein product, partial [Rotaria magnacalcarata]
MSSSLQKLVSNLGTLKILPKYFSNEKHLNLLKRKGVHPYDWLDDIKKFDKKQLPNKKEFNNSLN